MNRTMNEDGTVNYAFTYTEITAEYERLGYSYPKDDDFTEDEIEQAVFNLSDYYLYTDIATFNTGKTVPPAQLSAWANFAQTLGGEMLVEGSGFRVRRPTTDKEQREQALSNLKQKRYAAQRKLAEAGLARKAESLDLRS